MKFACDVCQTKYSIADEKVRRKVLKIRCKQCSAIITVREGGAHSDDGGALAHGESGAAPALRASEQGWQEGDGGARRSTGEQQAAKRGTGEAPIVRLVPRAPSRPPTPVPSPDWYLAVNGQQFGPMALGELQARLKRGEAAEDDHVWSEGLSGWQMVREVEELRSYCHRKPPPLPRDTSAIRPLPTPPSRSEELPPPPPSRVVNTSDSGLANVYRPPTGEFAVVPGAVMRPTAGMMAPSYLPALVAPQTQSPPWITIGFGVGFTLMAGILGLVVYALFFRSTSPELAPIAAAAPQAVPVTAAAAPPPAAPVADPSMLIRHERVPTPARTRTVAKNSSKALAAVTPTMTDEQRRLAELYGTKPDTKPTLKTTTQTQKISRITDRDIAQLQRDNQAGLKFCYERAAKRDPSLKQIRIDVTVDANSSGSVSGVSLSTQRGSDFGECLQKSIRRWNFPNTGSEYSITFPLLFQGM